MPRVSVVMPVFNGERFLLDAMNSVLSQTYRDFELIVIDDGSTDSSASIATSFSDERVRYIRNAENTGLARVRNKGLGLARGEFVAWLDCDDLSEPRRLEKQVAVLDRNPSLALCGSWVRTLGLPHDVVWQYPSSSEELRSRMLFDDPLATSAVVMRRSVLDSLSTWFDTDFPPAEDYELWERISRIAGLHNIPEVLTHYRLHANQITVQKKEVQMVAVRRVQSRLLSMLEVEVSPEEFLLHLAVGVNWEFKSDRDRVQATEQWLLKLERANARRHVFPEAAFRRVLADRWLRAVSAARGHGTWAWRIFHQSPISRWDEARLRRSVHLWLRCAVAKGFGSE